MPRLLAGHGGGNTGEGFGKVEYALRARGEANVFATCSGDVTSVVH